MSINPRNKSEEKLARDSELEEDPHYTDSASKSIKEKAITNAILSAIFSPSDPRIPGSAIKLLPKSIRRVLEQCTAEDWYRVIEAKKYLKKEK